MKTTIFLFALFIPVLLSAQISANVDVDFSAKPLPEPHYWRSTGFTPASSMLRPDMQLTLDYLGTTAGSGIMYARPHYMLNLVGTKGLGTNTSGIQLGETRYCFGPAY